MSNNIQINGQMNAEMAARQSDFLASRLVSNLSGEKAAFQSFFAGMMMSKDSRPQEIEEIRRDLASRNKEEFSNRMAEWRREHPRGRMPSPEAIMKGEVLQKSVLDVGTLTNLAQVNGGQSLGYISLDTQLARGTIRPDSFTLYQSLKKSSAFQVVDYWAYIDATGGPLPGAAFSGYQSVESGTLSTSAGIYSLNTITLKLATNGRAITVSLAAQNSFVDVQAQENANAALSVLESFEWGSFWGNPTLYPNQFQGLAYSIPTGNVYDWFNFWQSTPVQNLVTSQEGLSPQQALFNFVYFAIAQIAGYRSYGMVSHAFMSPIAAADIQSLVTTQLLNVTNFNRFAPGVDPIVIAGDLQGMKTRFGEIQFPISLLIPSRTWPAQAVVYYQNGVATTAATTTNPTKPQTVTAAVNATAAGSNWVNGGSGFNFVPTGNQYEYAVASTDVNMNESTLTYTSVVTGVPAGGSVTLTITPPSDTSAVNFRVYRSGQGYNVTSNQNPAAFRLVGEVAANGSSNVTFTDLNTSIPGAETIFLLDLNEQDAALDWRYLLPLTRVDLFAQNLYMPWAVASIGAVRNRIPKYHGMIKNYIPQNSNFSPFSPNYNATI